MNSVKFILIIFLLVVFGPCIIPIASPESATGYSSYSYPGLISVSTYFETIRNNPDKILEFFLEMPKGGGILIHLSGAVHPEDIINISARHGLLVDPENGQLVDPVTGQPSNYSPSQALIPVSSAYNNINPF